jgi:gluconate 2-dehydrogenase gamma chain
MSSVWLASHLPEILAAQEHAHRARESNTPTAFEYLTPEQATEIEAIAAQIIPTDDTPGAREARVIYFIDRALTTFAAQDRATILKGLKQLQAKVKKLPGKPARFSALNSDQQISLLKQIDKTPFFEVVRTLTVVGMFANPEYGGNHDQIGWKLIGFEDKFFFEPPFGYYDREYGAER